MRRKVLHLDSEMTWRGGENQMRLFLEGASPAHWQFFLAAPPESEAIRRLSPQVQTWPVPMRGLQILSATWQLAKKVRDEGIELIDCQSARAHNLGLLIKLLYPKVKLVVHRRVDYPPKLGYWHRKKYLSPLVDRYICISSAIYQILLDYGVPSQKLSLAKSAVAAAAWTEAERRQQRQSFRQLWQLETETPIIAQVAYLTPQKDQSTFLKALAILKQRGLAFFAFIAGEGEQRSALEKEAELLRLGPKDLQFLGVRTDISNLLLSSDIFALSSRDEGLGTSLLDAAHHGCALLGTKVGGIPEIILSEKTGLLVPRENPSAFADALQRLLTDPKLRQDLNAAARQHLKENFSLESMVGANESIYRELLANSAAD